MVDVELLVSMRSLLLPSDMAQNGLSGYQLGGYGGEWDESSFFFVAVIIDVAIPSFSSAHTILLMMQQGKG